MFADRFREVGSSAVAFGTNLLGAIVGGVLEYGALVVGYRALLIVVAALYGLAFLAGRSHLDRAPREAVVDAGEPRPRRPVPEASGAWGRRV